MDGNYLAMIVTLIIWVGLFFFVNGLNKKIDKIEKRTR